MKVRLLVGRVGAGQAQHPGEIVDLPRALARTLIRRKRAEAVSEKKGGDAEPTTPEVETAALEPARPRRRRAKPVPQYEGYQPDAAEPKPGRPLSGGSSIQPPAE